MIRNQFFSKGQRKGKKGEYNSEEETEAIKGAGWHDSITTPVREHITV